MTTDNQKIIEEPDALLYRIASQIDRHSVYMGGPSQQSLSIARRLLPFVEDERAALRAENARLVAVLDKIRALHVEVPDKVRNFIRGADTAFMCKYDGTEWPCETLRILDGSETP